MDPFLFNLEFPFVKINIDRWIITGQNVQVAPILIGFSSFDFDKHKPYVPREWCPENNFAR